MASKKNTQTSANPHVLVMNFADLVNALDARFDPTLDTGHDKRSTKDASLRVIIGSMCRLFHTQVFGEINGGGIPNTTKRVTDSHAQMAELQRKHQLSNGDIDYDRLVIDPAYDNALFYLEINEARDNVYKECLAECVRLYREITLEDWTPAITSRTTSTTTNAMTDDLRKRKAEEAKKRFARVA